MGMKNYYLTERHRNEFLEKFLEVERQLQTLREKITDLEAEVKIEVEIRLEKVENWITGKIKGEKPQSKSVMPADWAGTWKEDLWIMAKGNKPPKEKEPTDVEHLHEAMKGKSTPYIPLKNDDECFTEFDLDRCYQLGRKHQEKRDKEKEKPKTFNNPDIFYCKICQVIHRNGCKKPKEKDPTDKTFAIPTVFGTAEELRKSAETFKEMVKNIPKPPKLDEAK